VRLKSPHPWKGHTGVLSGPQTVTVGGHSRHTYLIALDCGRPVYADRGQFVKLKEGRP
jgi:hypothetical protein